MYSFNNFSELLAVKIQMKPHLGSTRLLETKRKDEGLKQPKEKRMSYMDGGSNRIVAAFSSAKVETR